MKRFKLTKSIQKLSFAVLTVMLAFAVIVSCDNAFVIDILPDRGSSDSSNTGKPGPNKPYNGLYNISIDTIGNVEQGDVIMVSPNTGHEGDTVVFSYRLDDTMPINCLNLLFDQDDPSTEIIWKDSAGDGRQPYTINPDDAENGVIKLYAVFIHDEIDPTQPATPTHVTITGLSANNKVYDGTTTAAVSGTPVISGLKAGDNVTVGSGTAEFANPNAGTGKTVTFKNWSLTGTDANKYLLIKQPSSVTANILKAPGSDVTQPTVRGTPTGKTITVNEVSLITPTGQSAEYAVSMSSNATGLSAWQSGVTFADLTESTTYFVYARSASNINYEAGKISSVSAGITTTPSVTTGFTVTFESNGGSYVPSQNVADGGFATRPANPVRSNYTFDYWYENAALTKPYYFKTHVTANITLYAKWVSNSDNEYTTGPDTGNINVIWVPGGTYLMGSPASEKGHKDNEGPQHEVTLSGFYMGKYEITQDQYRAVMGSNPSGFSGWNKPVECLTWLDAVKFCNQLSYREGLEQVYNIVGDNVTADFSKKGYRLPTEAEWEYACRAGTTTAFNNGNNDYNNIASVSEVAWFLYNSGNLTHDIGKKKPNDWKLYDMHGNVFEWCWDGYDEYYYSKNKPAINPTGPDNTGSKVIRGGSWENDDYSTLRSASRSGFFWNYFSSDIGFRVVRYK